MAFSHLHLHTEYSLLDGSIRVGDLIQQAKKYNMNALAITDHGVMYGVVDFYKKAQEAGIKPIIGCEVYVSPGSRFEKVAVKGYESAYHLVLLARNQEGYRNLVQLVSVGFLEGFYYKPRVDKESLRKHAGGLICLSACLAGEIPRHILNGALDEAEKVALEFQDIFGADNFYLEVQENGIPEQVKVNQALADLSHRHDIPLVATNDCHYLHAQDAKVHDVLLAIQTATHLGDPKRLRFASEKFYFKSQEEMEEDFVRMPQALENTERIAERCTVELELGKVFLPEFPVPEKFSADSYLRYLCEKGLCKRYGDPPDSKAVELLEYELGVIEQMGYSPYFLIVWDFVDYARRNCIMVGPGRGSAAGSIVAYSLGITNIDPIRNGLLFERFLNPERISMPDIDIDFCFERRDEVIEYVSEKYGSGNVAQIITFGRMMARQAVRDVGRALGWSYGDVDRIAKLIPGGPGITIDKALDTNPQLRSLVKENSDTAHLIDVARRIEGLCRHASVHAAGVVISNLPLTHYSPLQKMNGNEVVTQFDMDTLQELGLLKMDFLGLRTLTVMEKAVRIIRESRNQEIRVEEIPIHDTATYDLLSRGETIGVFQLESSGMKELLKRIRPEKIEDLTALLALYRPGPLGSGMIEDFIRRKHRQISISYPHPKMEKALQETYGVILYQEQVMKIASELAGFSMGQADILRRAMGKKKPEVMRELKERFIEGALERGYEKNTVEEVFELIEYFAGYGFNKSHSAAYALISYQTAYLKTHFSTEYLTACLTSVSNDSDKVAKFIVECKRLGIKVLPPDVNESLSNFTVVGERKIRFGLSAVKNVGENAVQDILTRRKEGRYKSVQDFLERVDQRVLNKRVIESLVKSGAFDELHRNRAQLLASLEDLSVFVVRKKKRAGTRQIPLFGEEQEFREGTFIFADIEEYGIREVLDMEKEMLGLYISDHPVRNALARVNHMNFLPIEQFADLKREVRVRLAGAVVHTRKIFTKNGKEMYFLTLEDESGTVEAVVFPNLTEKLLRALEAENVLCMEGRVDATDSGENKLIVENILVLSALREDRRSGVVHVELASSPEAFTMVHSLKDFVLQHKGTTPVVLHLEEKKERWAVELGDSFRIEWNSETEKEIRKLMEGIDEKKIWLVS